MKFSLEEISNVARNFLDTLEREGISHVNDIISRVGTNIVLDEKDLIVFDKKEHYPPKYLLSTSYVVDYVRKNSGIPIEFRINNTANYSTIIVKTQEIIDGYSPMVRDIFGNIGQSKDIRQAGFDIVKKELIRLKELKNKK